MESQSADTAVQVPLVGSTFSSGVFSPLNFESTTTPSTIMSATYLQI